MLTTIAVAIPNHQGARGHPVGFAPVCRDDLLALSGDVGARGVINRFENQDIVVDDPGCILDIDTPADLERAERIFSWTTIN